MNLTDLINKLVLIRDSGVDGNIEVIVDLDHPVVDAVVNEEEAVVSLVTEMEQPDHN